MLVVTMNIRTVPFNINPHSKILSSPSEKMIFSSELKTVFPYIN